MSKQRSSAGDPQAQDETPGKPTPSGSRQQTHTNQSSQSGSPAADRELTQRSGAHSTPTKPAGAK